MFSKTIEDFYKMDDAQYCNTWVLTGKIDKGIMEDPIWINEPWNTREFSWERDGDED